MRCSDSRSCTGSPATLGLDRSCWSRSTPRCWCSAGRSSSGRCSGSSTPRSICVGAPPRCAVRARRSREQDFARRKTSHSSDTSDQRRATMEVMLLERVGRLGHMGDIVRVKDGFARNFLLPKGKALRATKENKAKYEGMKETLETRNVELRGAAQQIGSGLDGKSFIVLRQASEGGQLYGSGSGRDVAAILNEGGFKEVNRSHVALNAPLKNIGLHKAPVALQPAV